MGEQPLRAERVASVDSALDGMKADTGAELNIGELQETTVNGHLYVFREWDGVIEGEPGRGISGVGSCDGRVVVQGSQPTIPPQGCGATLRCSLLRSSVSPDLEHLPDLAAAPHPIEFGPDHSP